MSLIVAAALLASVVGGVIVAPRAFAYVRKPQLADADLRAALKVIPREASLTAANFMNWSAASLEGHRFYLQPNVFFNYGGMRQVLHGRAELQGLLFSASTSEREKREILLSMGVTHLLIDKRREGTAGIPGCERYYENARYVVCRVRVEP